MTWPRSKFTILGQRDDGSVLSGEYLTGKTMEREKARSFTQNGFVDPAQLDTSAKKKQVVSLINGLPQTHMGIHQWCAANGHKIGGYSWETYEWGDGPDPIRTIVRYALL